jgi:hypothetical protein
LVDGAAARDAPEERQLDMGRHFGPGVLVAANNDTGIVHVEEEEALSEGAALEESLLEREVDEGIAVRREEGSV